MIKAEILGNTQFVATVKDTGGGLFPYYYLKVEGQTKKMIPLTLISSDERKEIFEIAEAEKTGLKAGGYTYNIYGETTIKTDFNELTNDLEAGFFLVIDNRPNKEIFK